MPHAQIELLINIEAKMRAGKGKGYERWAERHNTDVLASSMLYLIDNRISSYAELEHKIQSAVDRRTELKSAITSAQARMQGISKQKKSNSGLQKNQRRIHPIPGVWMVAGVLS